MRNKYSVAAFVGTTVTALTLGTFACAAPAPATKHKNLLQRHPTASAAVAGVATHHALKKAGRRRKAHGQHPNFAQRHPTLTGAAAAGATHHMLKKH